MKTQQFLKKLSSIIAVFSLAALVAFGTNVSMVSARESGERSESQESRDDRDDHRSSIMEDRRSSQVARLEDNKLRVCQNRSKSIKNILNHSAIHGARHLSVFTKIYERVKAFYEAKGKTLSNYDALVADVDAKKLAAENAVNAVKTASTEFNCEGENPKADAAAFKEKVKVMRTELHEYRTSIKNLIVGVKSVQSAEAKSDDGAQQ
jgi:hypothetical protein